MFGLYWPRSRNGEDARGYSPGGRWRAYKVEGGAKDVKKQLRDIFAYEKPAACGAQGTPTVVAEEEAGDGPARAEGRHNSRWSHGAALRAQSLKSLGTRRLVMCGEDIVAELASETETCGNGVRMSGCGMHRRMPGMAEDANFLPAPHIYLVTLYALEGCMQSAAGEAVSEPEIVDRVPPPCDSIGDFAPRHCEVSCRGCAMRRASFPSRRS